MIVTPRAKGFICTTAHPLGCRENILSQIAYAKGMAEDYHKKAEWPVKNVLVIGCSAGYGLASRIAAAFTAGCNTLGVMYEREAAGKRTATAGFYNTKAFEQAACREGLYSQTINGDAFSKEIKEQTIEKIRQDLKKIDLVIYSLASPRRTMEDGTVKKSVLKTVGAPFWTKSLNLAHNEIETVCLESATDQEIEDTISVMGGEDWMEWIDLLEQADVLSPQARTIAYSYLGPKLTYPIYQSGTIGCAKKHLQETADKINDEYADLEAYVCVNKAVVTQSSAAIPGVPLYLSALYRVMKEMGLHEDCAMQMTRLFTDRLSAQKVDTDMQRRIRMDDWELKAEVQKKVMQIWDAVTTENVKELCDLDGYWEDFYKMFGFGIKNVDYSRDVEV